MYDDDDDDYDYDDCVDDDVVYDDDDLEPHYTKDPEGNLVSFNLELLNSGMACSTIVVYNNDSFSADMATNVKRFKDLFASWDQIDGRYKIEQHAFIFASTTKSRSMEAAVEFFKAMGFQSIGPEYNSKNGTEVTHWLMPIKEFVQKLETAEKDFAEAKAKALREEEDSLQIIIDSEYRRLASIVENQKQDLDHFNNLLETFYKDDGPSRSRAIGWRDGAQKILEKSQELLDAHVAKCHKLWVSRKEKEEAEAVKKMEAA